jgi:ATP-dependent helicase/nuclease subunit B
MGNLRFILGRAGSGKTWSCLDQVAGHLAQSPLHGPAVILLVPEQATFQMNRMLAEQPNLKGFIRARVVSFKSLARAALQTESGSKHSILTVSRNLLMQQILTAGQDQLKFWKNSRPDRVSASILKLLDELIQTDLNPEKLQAIYDTLSARGDLEPQLNDKLSDIIRLSREYLKLDLAGLDDPIANLDRYRKMIGKIDWLQGCLLYVDGFSGFTGQEYAALMATIQTAKETHITLCLDPEQLGRLPLSEDLSHFWPSEQTYFRLIDLAKSTGVTVEKPLTLDSPIPPRFKNNPALAGIEGLFANCVSAREIKPSETILLISTEDPGHEVELAAGKILQLVREKNYQFRDTSIILRSLDSYEHLVRYTFEQYKIPFFLDVRRPIAHHPLTRMIQAAVGALATSYQTRWMLTLLKSGMTDVPTPAADRIENYVLVHGIDKARWLAEWSYRVNLTGRDDNNPATDKELDLKAINKHRTDLIHPLLSLANRIGLTDQTEQLFTLDVLRDGLLTFLRDTNVPGKLEKLQKDDPASQVHKQIWDVVAELFDQLRTLLAGQMISLTRFLTILTDSFAELTVGVIPTSVDQVLIGTIERSRHPAVRASFVLGFNEGTWPQPPEEDVVLTDTDRTKLSWPDLPLKGNLDQHFLREQYLTYTAFTRPGELLWISYPRQSISGVALQPSRYLRRIDGFIGKKITATHQPAGGEILFNADTPQPLTVSNLISETVIGIRNSGFDSEFKTWVPLADRLNQDLKTQSQFRKFVQGLCDNNQPDISGELAARLFERKVSFSQLESFYRCPFQHFCRYALRLKVQARYKLEPMDLGQFRHQVLALAWQEIVRKQDTWRQTDEARIGQIVEKAIHEAAIKLKNQVIFSNARNRYILERTRFELTLAIAEQLRMVGPGRFTPTQFEKEFNLSMDVDSDSFELIGRIDRVDLARPDGRTWVIIVDYKSGSAKFKLKDWLAGVQLQLPGYLFVATTNRDQAAGAIFLPLAPQRAKADGCMFPAGGLMNLETLPHLTDQPNENYPYGIKIKKDGSVSETGPVTVLPDEVLSGILHKTRDLVTEALKAIDQGNLAIQPYIDNHTSVCPLCELRGICRFDPYLNRYRTTEPLTKEEIFTQLKKV